MHTVRPWARALAVVLAGAVFAAACGDDDDGSSAASQPARAATSGSAAPESNASTVAAADKELCTAERVGGSIVVLSPFSFSGLDPALLPGAGFAGGDIAGAFYDTLVRYNAVEDRYEPRIVEEWESNDDRTEWTIRIREGVTFGNGDPFTVDHLIAHVERMKGVRVKASSFAQLIAEIRPIDDVNAVVTLTGPFNFPYLMAGELAWVPNMNLVAERGEGLHANPLGAGAGAYEFRSLSSAAGESLVLVAKDDWWGGDVCIEQIEYRYVPGDDARLQAFQREEGDVMAVGSQRVAAELSETGALAYDVTVGWLGYILMDQGITGREDSPFKDARVREALQLAVDYDLLAQRIHEGTDPAPTSAIVPETSPVWTGVEGPPFDQERARELVAETVADGVWDGSFTLTHGPDPQQIEEAILFEAMWEAVGMDVTLESAPNLTQRTILEPNFEVSFLGGSLLPPSVWTALRSLRTGSNNQRTGFSDPDMDRALDQLQAALTTEEIRDALAEVQEVWNRTFPTITARHGRWGWATRPGIHGLQFGPDSMPYFDLAWIEP